MGQQRTDLSRSQPFLFVPLPNIERQPEMRDCPVMSALGHKRMWRGRMAMCALSGD